MLDDASSRRSSDEVAWNNAKEEDKYDEYENENNSSYSKIRTYSKFKKDCREDDGG